ncbi:hypothetical protein FOCC_FOCC003791 [Frankliniella occidentalis]|nr:hypothetical protein FOCC_FOCC003791 [Frankliniella occidentalis]
MNTMRMQIYNCFRLEKGLTCSRHLLERLTVALQTRFKLRRMPMMLCKLRSTKHYCIAKILLRNYEVFVLSSQALQSKISYTFNKRQDRSNSLCLFCAAVEIRAQETSKGGVKYEAILAEPAIQSPPKRNTSPLRTPKATVEEKLKAAEERRLSYEANKMAQLAAQMEKIEIIAKKREEEVSKRKEALDKKIESAVEKRDAHISSVKGKAKEQTVKVELLAKKIDEEASKKKEALEKKIESHVEKREAHINSVKEKVKDHLKKGEETRQNLDKQAEEINQALQESLKKAAEQREDNIKKMLERLQERDRRAELVRQNKERLSSSFSESQQESETASSG